MAEKDKFEEIKARWRGVSSMWSQTPPPWEAKQFTPFGPRRFVISRPTGRVVLELQGSAEAQEAMVQAPIDVAWLLDEVELLRARVPSKEFVAAVDYASTVLRHELPNRYTDTRKTLREFAARFHESDPEEG